jgi:predicted nucleic acid-binding protein
MSGDPAYRSGKRVVVDTSVLIDLAGGDRTAALALNGLDVYISIIACIEFLAWPKLTEAGLPSAMALLDQYTTENIGRSVRDDAAWIKRVYKLKVPDAVIAATAKHLNAPLITRDKGFKKIAHLVEVRLV